jgi:peptidoglycan-N-acetylglucosamine deacetylase
VLYLATFSAAAARAYFATALRWCSAARVEPSVLLHPLDFLGPEDAPSLAFFPAMRLSAAHKLECVEECLDALASRFELISLGEHARAASVRSDLPEVEPRFDGAVALQAG